MFSASAKWEGNSRPLLAQLTWLSCWLVGFIWHTLDILDWSVYCRLESQKCANCVIGVNCVHIPNQTQPALGRPDGTYTSGRRSLVCSTRFHVDFNHAARRSKMPHRKASRDVRHSKLCGHVTNLNHQWGFNPLQWRDVLF